MPSLGGTWTFTMVDGQYVGEFSDQAFEAAPLVLVADDDPVICTVLSKKLAAGAYEVRTARDGRDALDCFYEYNPALAILDVRMPGLDGFEVCRAMRAKANVPVIFVTGSKDPFMATHMEALTDRVGATCFLTKPLDCAALMKVVDEVLNHGST